LALGEVGKEVEKMLREDQLQNRVSEELETLIVKMMALGFVPEAGVGEGLL
jgi:hypothetical protein